MFSLSSREHMELLGKKNSVSFTKCHIVALSAWFWGLIGGICANNWGFSLYFYEFLGCQETIIYCVISYISYFLLFWEFGFYSKETIILCVFSGGYGFWSQETIFIFVISYILVFQLLVYSKLLRIFEW